MNELYYGDNLEVLRNKIARDSVDLCYIDPPFNSKRNYFQIYTNVGTEDQAQAQAFIDTWTWNLLAEQALREIIGNDNGRYTTQTVELIKGLYAVLGAGGLMSYLLSMTQRVNEIQRVLKPTGSFYLHCDPTASHYLKLVLDSVFCPRGGDYVNEISWRRTNTKNDYKQGAQNWGRVRDVIFTYAKNANLKRTFNQQFTEYSDDYLEKFYKHQDADGRRYALDNLAAPGAGSRGHPSYEFMGVTRFWRYNKEKMEQLLKDGRIIQSKKGAVPRYKRYLDEMSGVSICDDWGDISSIQAQSKERLGYPTQKPEALLERIIQASSNEGDVVLDAYCGCGTTIAVAQRLNRQWIGIDITYQSIAVILKRMTEKFGAEVANAIILSGIPKDMASAQALALKKDDRLRKEFEKWAVLTYTNNQAAINEKKGADKGIDGVAYTATGSNSSEKVVFQVKSGKVGRGDIAKLKGDQAREKAVMAFLITLNEPTKDMVEEALMSGIYHHPLLRRDYPCIQIVTIRAMLEQKQRFDLPHVRDVLKKSEFVIEETQQELTLNDNDV